MFDFYCERTDSSFWSEPFNALTNIAFILAGLFAFYLLSKKEEKPYHLTMLASLMVIIGIGSFLFHTFASYWSLLSDIIPIYLFQILFIWAYQRYKLNFSLGKTILGFSLFFAAIIVSKLITFDINGSEIYLPSICMLIIFGLLSKHVDKKVDKVLFWASFTFTVSIILRSIDMMICEQFPLGTHVGWHTLNAVVVFLCWYSLFEKATQAEIKHD